MSRDRRAISRLLKPHFPSMPENATSDEWHGFLDEVTGLETPHEMSNAEAFDRWRKALAEQGYPVWGVTPERAAEIKARAEELKTEESKRMAELPERLAKLKAEAPLKTAADLMSATEIKP